MAAYGRLGGASVIVDDAWLIIGGEVRTYGGASGQDDATFTNASQTISSTITTFNTTSRNVTDTPVNIPAGPNRMNVRSQTCEYDRNQTRKVYCFGGRSVGVGDQPWVSGIGVYDPVQNSWGDDISTNITNRWGHASVFLGGRMYIIGGWGSLDNGSRILYGDVWSFDPSTGTAQQTSLQNLTIGSINSTNNNNTNSTSGNNSNSTNNATTTFPARAWHCATPVNGTAFVIIGGTDISNASLADAWVYNIPRGVWTNVTSQVNGGVPLGRAGRSCNLANGTIYMFGGFDGQLTLHNDLWTMSNASFSGRQLGASAASSPAAPSPRVFAQSTILGSFFALFGGETTFNNTINDWVADDRTVRLFDPSGDAWLTALPTNASLAPPPPVPGQTPPTDPEAAVGGPVTTTETDGDDDDDHKGAIIGGVLGGIGALLLLLAWLFAVRHYHRRKRAARYQQQHDVEHGSVTQPMAAISGPMEGRRLSTTIRNSQQQRQQQQQQAQSAHHGTSPPAALAAGVAAALGSGAAALRGRDQSRTTGTGESTPRASSLHPPASHISSKSEPSRTTPGAAAGASTGAANTTAGNTTGKRYRAGWPHIPEAQDELLLHAGDLVTENHAFADGWSLVTLVGLGSKSMELAAQQGTNAEERKGRSGMVPRNILKEIA
ncbi:hypothetical protein HK104_010766 [Borealophlyctis nickersoniae]|nr:hypothetical protein HK104_010766 [Borealophlyctis nickersoniae]